MIKKVYNEDTSEVIRGSKDSRHYNDYNLEFIKSKSKKKNICPNCGGTLQNHECENCHAIVDNGYSHFVLNKKSIRK